MKTKILAALHVLTTAARSGWFRFFTRNDSGKFHVLGSIKMYNPTRITIGAGTTINHGCILNAMEHLEIGENVRLSPGVIINTGGLDYKKTGENRNHLKSKVCIESGVWIGSGAIINPGVLIGADSVIGAGSVVTKDVPARTVAMGVPAVVVKGID